MAVRQNFLLGYGERLTAPVKIEKGMEPSPPPYSFNEARDRLAPHFLATAAQFEELPPAACPDNYAVALVTLHPEYTAKSYFPSNLLREARLEAIGSRPGKVKPEKWKKKRSPEEVETTQLYVAARRDEFAAIASQLPRWSASHGGADQLFELETLRAVQADDRILPIVSKSKELLLEVVLHTSGIPNPDHILEAFEAYAKSLNLKPDLDRRFEVGGLCFLPMPASRSAIPKISQFAFLRATREMPGLRPLRPVLRSSGKSKPFSITLPAGRALDPQLRAAVFDGGIPDDGGFAPFAELHEPAGIGEPVEEYLDHGTAVTSALLFGPLEKDVAVSRPYGGVDHFRVLDGATEDDPYELYDALARIRDVLQSRKYPFVNLSIGPALPIEDHEVHAWTAVLDDLISDGETLATIAVGNNGESDWASGNARVQVPSDSVNSLAVGATNTRGAEWKRASYSCIGPGRSPGLIKPDVVAFGGIDGEPFFALDRSLRVAVPQTGTSFASPYALRMGMGIRAHFGTLLSTLAIKALLVHCSETQEVSAAEIGWGRIPQSLDEIVICPDGLARVVYQGDLTPAQYLRTSIPLPAGKLDGNVSITATFCFASETDPQDPSNYTRGGLDITFRPHIDKRDEDKTHAKSKSFFRRTDYDKEAELRHDAHKWETTLHRRHTFRATSLKEPLFDVHYQTRQAGQSVRGSEKIRFALIITVEAPKVRDLYDRVVQRYRTQLEPLRPIIEIPIRT